MRSAIDVQNETATASATAQPRPDRARIGSRPSKVRTIAESIVSTPNAAREIARTPIAGSAPLESRCPRTAPTPSQIAAGAVTAIEGTHSIARISARRARRSLQGDDRRHGSNPIGRDGRAAIPRAHRMLSASCPRRPELSVPQRPPHSLGRQGKVDVANAQVRDRVHDRVLDGRVDPTVADSPIPFAPSGFRSVGVSVFDASNVGRSAALGI